MIVIVDVWGGPWSMDHVARYICTTKEALTLAEHELDQGFMVNMRKTTDPDHSPLENFDSRM